MASRRIEATNMRLIHLRSGALITAVVLLGISWSFTLMHIKSDLYPVLWAAAMPLLAAYYSTGGSRIGRRWHLIAGALTVYALVLWQAVHGYGVTGRVSAAAAILLSLGVVGMARWLMRPPEPRTAKASAKSRRRDASRHGASAHR